MNTYKAIYVNCCTRVMIAESPADAMRELTTPASVPIISVYERIPGTEDGWNDGGYNGWRKVVRTDDNRFLHVMNQGEWDRWNPF